MKELKEHFKGLTWKEAVEKFRSIRLLMAFSGERELMIVKEFEKNEEAGMAALSAHLYLEQNGTAMSYRLAVKLYKEGVKRVAKKNKGKKGQEYLNEVSDQIHEMDCWVAWSSHMYHPPPLKKEVWDVKPNWRSPHKWGGFANLLLYFIVVKMGEEGSDGMNNTELIAVRGIRSFLDWKAA